jgi:hypothetical protein
MDRWGRRERVYAIRRTSDGEVDPPADVVAAD